MCAIAGILALPFDDTIVKKMQLTMMRRGPDGSGVFRTPSCCLLHTRLAIIDPAGGTQPMGLNWGGEAFTITYNGELYNTEDIRRELLALGHQFQGHSDTEVLLHAYAQWGEDCLYKCNGIFAFAVWEHRKKELFLARDRMGVKPVFYKEHEDGFLFASEIKTILQYPTVKAELDTTGIGEILLLGPGRTPGSGVLRGIRELEPGCCGRFSQGRWKWKRYWKLMDREHLDSFSETVEKVSFLVKDAIQRQMISDVPIGTFLSGGLDSSIITAVCAGKKKETDEVLPTFSLDYRNNERFFVPGKFQPTSDTEYIHIMEDWLGNKTNWSVLTPDDLTQTLEQATLARDLPGMADVDFSLLKFCGDIRKHVKVALSGECADEIFGGYPWYRDPEVRALNGFPWAQNTLQRSNVLHPQVRRDIVPEAFIQERYEMTLQESDILPGTSPEQRRIKELVNLNHRWFMQTLLDRKDRMSMYHGLEVRVPFCDFRIAEYLYSVPWEMKDHDGMEKGLLRHAARGLLPDQVLFRKKSPYPKTYDPRYLELVSAGLRELLEDKNEPIFDIINMQALEELLDAEYLWPWYGQLMKVPQTIAFVLQINFWLKYYHISIV